MFITILLSLVGGYFLNDHLRDEGSEFSLLGYIGSCILLFFVISLVVDLMDGSLMEKASY